MSPALFLRALSAPPALLAITVAGHLFLRVQFRGSLQWDLDLSASLWIIDDGNQASVVANNLLR